jgi:hypothetical protein
MALYNTTYDAANTAVRAFLTKIGEYYLERPFNTGSGLAKQDWMKIRDEIFEGSCAYCGTSGVKLQMDHLIMFNRQEFGLHHPGNIVPACSSCNKRTKDKNGKYNSWENHLSIICERNNTKNHFFDRWKRIKQHIDEGEFAYPKLTEREYKAIKIIANNLYDRIKTEFEASIELYQELDKEFIK